MVEQGVHNVPQHASQAFPEICGGAPRSVWEKYRLLCDGWTSTETGWWLSHCPLCGGGRGEIALVPACVPLQIDWDPGCLGDEGYSIYGPGDTAPLALRPSVAWILDLTYSRPTCSFLNVKLFFRLSPASCSFRLLFRSRGDRRASAGCACFKPFGERGLAVSKHLSNYFFN